MEKIRSDRMEEGKMNEVWKLKLSKEPPLAFFIDVLNELNIEVNGSAFEAIAEKWPQYMVKKESEDHGDGS